MYFSILQPQIDRTDRLPKIQFLFNINEGKRSSLEQKVLKDLLMSGGGLGELGGNLGGMLEAFTGKDCQIHGSYGSILLT